MAQRVQFRRLLHIVRVLTAHGVAHLVARHARWRWLLRLVPIAELTGPRRFRRLFEDLGGSFIKFGQMLALQPDIVTLEYSDELFNLLDRIAPFDYAHVEQVFAEELGATPAELFDTFSPEPLATASIGQVHVAQLHGRSVAVKVQRPSVDVDFMGDIRLMTFAMRLIRRFEIRSLFWTLEPMGEFVAWTREELDYRREARYAERLRRNAVENAFERVPEVFWDLTTRRVMAMDYVEGVPLETLSRLDVPQARRDAIGALLERLLFRELFEFRVMQTDPNFANYLYQPESGRIALLDFGATKIFSTQFVARYARITLAVIEGDLDAVAREAANS